MSTPASTVAPTSLGPPVSTGVLAVTHPNQPVHRCPPWLAGRSILFTSQVQLSTLSTTLEGLFGNGRWFFVVTEGILDTGFVQENGFSTQVKTQLGTYQATVFPMGSIHFQQNPTCSPAIFVAGFGNEDPGRSDIATNFWMLDSDVIDAALGFPTTIGGDNIDEWRYHLPVNLAAGVDSCLQKCGLSQ
ncbi:hypothetical protein B0H11DRAFT_2262264 [Mycena galericulata]|nr:hypothetical protein B0H11DRAFT_2262264 [Mycena galericulata]